MSVKIDFPNSNEFVKKLKKDMPNAMRFAAASTLTRIAFSGVKKSERAIKKGMNLRNKYTVGNKTGNRGIRYNRAKPRRNMNLIFSEFGALKSRDYLADQHDGFRHKGIVPAKAARTSKKYDRRIRKKNYLRAMAVKKVKDYKGKGKGNPRRARAMLYMAYKSNFGLPGSSDFFYLKKNQYNNFKAGFYQFARKRPNKAANSYPHLKKFFHGKKTTNMTRYGKPWLKKALEKFTQKEIDLIFLEETKKQLKRHNLI